MVLKEKKKHVGPGTLKLHQLRFYCENLNSGFLDRVLLVQNDNF